MEDRPPTWRAVIFDLDGTLIDSIDDITDAMNSVLAGHDFPIHSVNRYKQLVGEGVAQLVRRALPTGSNPALIDDLTIELRDFYGENWVKKTLPYPGIKQLLHQINKSGRAMAVLSNKPDGMTKTTVNHFFSEFHFASISGAHPDYANKPDPVRALEITRLFALNPSNCLLVGDSEIDIQTAQAAGMKSVGVTWGFRSADQLSACRPDHLVDLPLEIMKIR